MGPGGWLASPDRSWLVRLLYRGVRGRQDPEDRLAQAIWAYLQLFVLPLVLMAAAPFLLFGFPVIVLARTADSFVRRHFRGQDLARRPRESWQAWERRVADEVGIPVVSVWLRPDDPCTWAYVVTGGGPGPASGQRLGTVILAMAGGLHRRAPKVRPSTELRLWASTATVLLVVVGAVIGWLALRYPLVRWVLGLSVAILALRLLVRRVSRWWASRTRRDGGA
jgi:hypothetical protein